MNTFLTPERRQDIGRKANDILKCYRGYPQSYDRLLKIAQDAGVELLEADTDDIAGALKCEQGTWRIYINRQDSPTRQLFTLAHELAHYFLHREGHREFVDGEFVMNRDESNKFQHEELEANEFAANLVMPEHMIRDRLKSPSLTEREIIQLADVFHVSPLAMVLRLKHIGYETPSLAA